MKRLGLAAAVLVIGVGTASAQTADPQCTGNTADACQKALDLFKYIAPQLGTAIAGGNSTLGQGGVLGGLPHWTIGARATIVSGSFPSFSTSNAPDPTVTTPKKSAYATSTTPVPFAAIDGSIGVFGGIPLGLTKVGGVDLIGNLAYVPSVDFDAFSVAPNTNIKIGGGVRVGLLQESLVVPGVAVSVIKRGLPTTTITATTTSGSSSTDTLQVKDLDLSTMSYRLTVSKSLIIFGVAAGVGMDKYSSSASVNTIIHRTLPIIGNQRTSGSFKLNSDMTRTNAFADLYMNLLLLKIVGEVGIASGGTLDTYNTFDKLGTASRPYGAVGLRIGF